MASYIYESSNGILYPLLAATLLINTEIYDQHKYSKKYQLTFIYDLFM